MFRAIALSLALLVGMGTIIPLATDLAEAGPKTTKKKKRSWRGVTKFSKRWWQLYRAQDRRKKLRAKRTRSLRLRHLRFARTRSVELKPTAAVIANPVVEKPMVTPPQTAVLPSGNPAPTGWRPADSTPAELQFRVDNTRGDQVGSATISVVGPANPEQMNARKTVGGVPTTSLRREVIDRMVRENGWIVNDYQQEISGQQVYVVVAQSQDRSGGTQSRIFYFTEVDGRIYSVTTNSPQREAERLAEESEKVIKSLKSRLRPAVRASN